ncbi:MAG: aminomethyl transferase family protein, partial [Pseudomonadota bacterium]
FPVKPEFSNWIDEQKAWRNSAIFQNMSHHMTDVFFQGPDVIRLLSDLGINSFDGFGPMQAKQYVVCNYDGQLIGDAVLFCETENAVSLVGKPMAANWVRYHAEKGDYDVEVEHIDRPSPRLLDRRRFRFQVQGPNADKLFEDLNGGSLPDIPFFKMGRFKVGPHEVVALNHRMSGFPGFEFWGPSDNGDEVRQLILEAGEKYGLTQIGGRTYPVTAAVSGWVGSILPAVYTGEKMRDYRAWLPAEGPEGRQSIGGSLATGRVEDFYRTPYDLGYGFMVKFDHDFIGRAALEAMSLDQKLKKVRLVWNPEDVVDIYASGFSEGDRYKKIELPVGNYTVAPSDRVLLGDKEVGVSFYPAYSEADRTCISLASIRPDLAVEGQELTLIWGEPGGGSGKPTVERHVQKAVRVFVDPKPIKRH